MPECPPLWYISSLKVSGMVRSPWKGPLPDELLTQLYNFREEIITILRMTSRFVSLNTAARLNNCHREALLLNNRELSTSWVVPLTSELHAHTQRKTSLQVQLDNE